MQKDVIIVGGGIVGLATALNLLQQDPALKILVIEKEKELALHQTGNNSGVIHSGLYYKPGSLKARNCIRGYNLLINFCRRHEIPFDLCGKIVVATDKEELPLLDNLYRRGEQNGLGGLKMLHKEALREYEPHVNGISGFFVPQTGIVDYRMVAQKYGDEVRKLGGEIVLGERVSKVVTGPNGLHVETDKKGYEAKLLINCAGLYSDKVAQLGSESIDVRIIPFRGEYYKLRKEREYLVRNLIYPVPDPNFPFLGVHFTRLIHGGIEAGPNAVLAFAREGYGWSNIIQRDLSETLMYRGLW